MEALYKNLGFDKKLGLACIYKHGIYSSILLKTEDIAR